MDFLIFLFKISVFLLSLIFLVFAISPGLCLSLGRTTLSFDNSFLEKRDVYLNSPDPVSRVTAEWFFAMVDNRLIVGYIGFVGLFISLVFN